MGGGAEFQARLNAYVCVHILARLALRWTTAEGKDVPSTLRSESEGAGDDLRIELVGSELVYECQAKRGLSADDRLDDAIDGFGAGLPDAQAERGILIVDAGSARTIRMELRDGLEAWRQGKRPEAEANAPTKRAIDRLRAMNAVHAADRIYVQEVDVEADASPAELHAREVLERILDDRDQVGAAWAVLLADGMRLVKQGGQRSRDSIVAILGNENIALSGSSRGTMQQLTAIATMISDGQAETRDLLAGIARVSVPAGQKPSEADVYSVHLDSAKELLNGGDGEAALAVLRANYEHVRTATVATFVRHRNLMAAALLQLGRTDEARADLGAVLAVAPNDVTATTNLAQCELISGEIEKAVALADKVIATEPHSIGAWSIKVQARPGIDVPAHVSQTSAVLTALGVAQLRDENWEAAIPFLRDSLAKEFDPECAVFLAQAMYGAALMSDSGADDPRLDEARNILEQALATGSVHRSRRVLESVHISKGQIARLGGDHALAAQHFGDAQRAKPDSERAAYLLGLSWLDQGQPARALFTAEDFLSRRDSLPLQFVQARAQLGMNDNDAAKATFSVIADNVVDPDVDADLRVAIVELALDAGWIDEAEQILATAPPPEAYLASLFAARVAGRRGLHEAADSAFQAAISHAPIDVVSDIRPEYAAFLRESGKPSRAVEELELAGAFARPKLRSLYARSLFEAQEHAKVAALVAQVESEGTEIPGWALKAGSFIATLADDVPAAISYLSRLAERSPGDIEASLRLTEAYIRNRDPESAVTLLNNLSARSDLASRQLLHMAELYIRTGEPHEALPLAYRAVRAEPDADDVHLAYVNLFLQREEDLRDPMEVDVETRVTLRDDDGAETTYFILPPGESSGVPGEVKPGGDVATHLMGKKVGDCVTFRAGAASETQLTVSAVDNRYVYAFQDILTNFPQRHPNNVSLQSFKVPDAPTPADLEPIMNSVKAHADSEAAIEKLYDENHWPLGAYARLMRGSVRDAYGMVAGRSALPMVTEFYDALVQARAAAASDRIAVVTRSALVTMDHLAILEIVPIAHPNLCYPQSLLDEMLEERLELSRYSRDGYAGATHGDDGFGINKISAAEIQDQLVRLDDLIAWLPKYAKVKSRPLETIGLAHEKWLRPGIGQSSYDSLMLARSLDGEVYADDLGLRRMQLTETGRFGFSTFALLSSAHERKMLSDVDYDRHIAKLLRLNHHSIALTPSVIVTALEDSGFTLTKAVMLLIERLRNASGTVTDLINFAADVLRGTALSHRGRGYLASISLALLEAIGVQHGKDRTLALLRHSIRPRFALLPIESDVVNAALDRYETFVLKGRSMVDPPAP